MDALRIRDVGCDDVATWMALSKEYDGYVLETAADLAEWYEGGVASLSFGDYMAAKIGKREAFMAVDAGGECCGIVAVSRRNNNITFFGTFHRCDVLPVGDFLLRHALSELDARRGVKITGLKSRAEHIRKINELFGKHGFVRQGDVLENGVPVVCLEKSAAG